MKTKMWGEFFVKENGYYRDIIKMWQFLKYGFYPCGLFDLIYNTCRKLIDEKDTSDWGYEALVSCVELLEAGIRYPWYEAPKTVAKNRIDEAFSKLWWNLSYKVDDTGEIKRRKFIRFTKHQKYGPPTKLTRDPYIYFFTACVVLNRLQFIHVISIPWYLYSRITWRWHKYLKNPTEENLQRYETLENKNHPRKGFVKNLQKYRRLAVEQLKTEK